MNTAHTAPRSGSPPLVAIVVLNWNNFEDSMACIESVLASDYPRLQVIVVDNASTDGSYERLASSHPDMCIVRNARNEGFSRGCNAGIRQAMRDSNVAHVVLVNNDCRVAPGAISAAVAEMERIGPVVGIVTAKILFDEISRRIWHAGGRISKWWGQAKSRGFGEPDVGQYDIAEDTGWASGALMMVRREALERVGLLPEEYFFGVEEWDYSLTVVARGFRIRYCPGFVGFHRGDGSHKNQDERFVYNYYRNKLIFAEKFLGPRLFKPWRVLFSAYLLLGHRRKAIALARKHGYEIASVHALTFAAKAALRDHRKSPLTDETLERFARELHLWRASAANQEGNR